MSIGFWVSYYNEVMGHNSSFYTEGKDNGLDANGQYTNATKLGLLDQARLLKAVQYKENAQQKEGKVCINYYKGTTIVHSRDWGIFSVNDYWFPLTMKKTQQYKNFKKLGGLLNNDIWKTNNFANIGAGIGMFYSYQFNGGGRGMNTGGFTLNDALHCIKSYNPGNPLESTVMMYANMMNHRFPGKRKPPKKP
jgi:hypothetical protein